MDNTEEIWKDVLWYEGLYRVSNLGRIYSIKSNKILAKIPMNSGYLRCNLYLKGVMKTCLIHRVVLTAFSPPLNSSLEANHIDGNKQNNYISNLEWVTPSENMIHAYKLGLKRPPSLIGEKNGSAELTENEVRQIRYLRKNDYITYKELAKMFHISTSQINRIVNNQNWSHVPDEPMSVAA